MKFYNRTQELAELQRIQNLSFTDHSRMVVITGRKRIGKTSLVLKSVENTPTIYLFVGHKTEAMLCAEYIPLINLSLNMFVPNEIRSFSALFQYLMELGITKTFNLIIDEFQEFYSINESIYSDMQNIWDQYRRRTHINLILSGSIYSLMRKISPKVKESLLGKAENIMKLSTFDTKTLKEIMCDYRPQYTNDDLLALYSFSGGVPKYIELFCDNNMLTINEMIEFMVRDNSTFFDEGKNLLIEEFGKNYTTYFSILSAVAVGINTQPKIESVLGDKSIGGHIKRLFDDYGILLRKRPLGAKDGTQTVRFEIIDHFLHFWFNYFERHRSLIETKNFAGLQSLIKADYPAYSDKILERYFKQQFAESYRYRDISSWWEAKGNQDEIDIVALKKEKKQAVAVEVMRQKENFKPELLAAKTEQLQSKLFPNYKIENRCLSLEDM